MTRPKPLLLDASALLAVTNGKLPLRARMAYLDPDVQTYLSVVALWEIGIKHALGKLSLETSYESFLSLWTMSPQVTLLPLDFAPLRHLSALPHVHGEPFDRLLVCVARELGAVIASSDRVFERYGVDRVW